MKKGPAGVNDPLWKDIPANDNFFYHESPGPEGLGTSFKAAVDKDAVYFLIDCPEPKMSELRDKTGSYDPRNTHPRIFTTPDTPPMPPVWGDDCVEVYLAPENDHHGYYRFCLAHNNMRETTYHKIFVVGWRCDIQPNIEKLDLLWEHDVRKYKNKWVAYFKIPFVSLKLDPKTLACAWGLNVIRSRTPKPFIESRWNQTFSGTHFPLNFGVLYLQKPKLHVNRVTFGKEGEWQVRLSDNEMTITAENLSDKPFVGQIELVIMQGSRGEEEKFYTTSKDLALPPGGEEKLTLHFKLHYMERNRNRACIKIEDDKRNKVYEGSYGFGNEGLSAHMDYLRDGVPPNPKPSDKNFYEKKICYIIKKLPRFIRRNTSQRAPSDFYLEAHDGSVAFNLMEAGCLQKIADYIYGLFDNDNDRLAAVPHFMNQRDVMNYSHSNNSLSGFLSPLSAIRVGGGICSTYSAVVLGICEKMKCDATGENYRGWTINFPGHVMTVVQKGEQEVLLDGSIGRFYYKKDNKTLAGPADLCKDHDIVERAGKGLVKYFPTMDRHRCYLPPAQVAWPQGAPIE